MGSRARESRFSGRWTPETRVQPLASARLSKVERSCRAARGVVRISLQLFPPLQRAGKPQVSRHGPCAARGSRRRRQRAQGRRTKGANFGLTPHGSLAPHAIPRHPRGRSRADRPLLTSSTYPNTLRAPASEPATIGAPPPRRRRLPERSLMGPRACPTGLPCRFTTGSPSTSHEIPSWMKRGGGSPGRPAVGRSGPGEVLTGAHPDPILISRRNP
jgi:hypothetical protein